MSAPKVNMRNDRVHKACAEIGYCCPYAFFQLNSSKNDTNKRLAKKLNMTWQAMKFNKRQIREGKLGCEGQPGCQLKANEQGS